MNSGFKHVASRV